MESRQKYDSLRARFKKIGVLGEGSSGKVYLSSPIQPQGCHVLKCRSEPITIGDREPNAHSLMEENRGKNDQFREVYALKKLKLQQKWKDMHQQPGLSPEKSKQNIVQKLWEVQLMRNLNHPNLMGMQEIVVDQSEGDYFIVMQFGFELRNLDLSKLSPTKLRDLLQQIVEGLSYLHELGYIHRDVKPSNIYLLPDGTVKLGDFSISRRMDAKMTPNVTTRHYRAPQLIFGSKDYTQSIDIWSLGCTIGELLRRKSLFAGTTDIEQLSLIFKTVGYPQHSWTGAKQLPYYLEFAEEKSQNLFEILKGFEPSLVDLVARMLTLDPGLRPTCKQILQHPYFSQMGKSSPEQSHLFAHICSSLATARLQRWVSK